MKAQFRRLRELFLTSLCRRNPLERTKCRPGAAESRLPAIIHEYNASLSEPHSLRLG